MVTAGLRLILLLLVGLTRPKEGRCYSPHANDSRISSGVRTMGPPGGEGRSVGTLGRDELML